MKLAFLFLICFNLLESAFQQQASATNSSLVAGKQPKNDELETRRALIRTMALEAYGAYVKHAWTNDELLPKAKVPNGRLPPKSGFTIVASITTLWTLGLTEQFEQAKQWIDRELDLSKLDGNFNTFELLSGYTGSLLSAYSLTGDEMFLNKAKQIVAQVEPAFNVSSKDNPNEVDKGYPYKYINPKTGLASGASLNLSEVGGFQAEFQLLSGLTQNPKYRTRISKIRQSLNASTVSGLYKFSFSIDGSKASPKSTVDQPAKEWYRGLINSYILSNGADKEALSLYRKAIESIEKAKLFHKSDSGLTFARGKFTGSNTFQNEMLDSACYLGAMLAQGAYVLEKETNGSQTEKAKLQTEFNLHWQLAKNLTETCLQASIRTKVGLLPSVFEFNGRNEAVADSAPFDLGKSSNLAESLFTLWRLTKDVQYRNAAWQLAQNIHRHCRNLDGSYSGLKNVYQIPYERDNLPNVAFLSSTLKYLYLTFTDDLLPLEKFIFNAYGQPLPVCGKVPEIYPASRCNV